MPWFSEKQIQNAGVEKPNRFLQVVKEVDTSFPMGASLLTDGFYVSVSNALIGSLSDEDRKLIQTHSTDCNYKIPVVLFDGDPRSTSSAGKKLCGYWASASLNGSGQFVIGWKVESRVALQRLFPFTEAMRVLGADVPEGLREELGVFAYPGKDGKAGSWVFYAKRTVKEQFSAAEISAKDAPGALEALVRLMVKYGRAPHLGLASEKERKDTETAQPREHVLRLEKSTEWMDANQFEGEIRSWENIIYTLASDPDENGVRVVYIGEATNPQESNYQRIEQQRPDGSGKVYIDHTKEEAAEHHFTRFRIDKLDGDATEYLHDMQDLAIGVSLMLSRECPSGFRMVNDALSTSFGEAKNRDINERRDK